MEWPVVLIHYLAAGYISFLQNEHSFEHLIHRYI